jgi:hypothetical protein
MLRNKGLLILGIVMLLVGGVGGYQFHIHRLQGEVNEFFGVSESAADRAADARLFEDTAQKRNRGES